MSNEITTPYIAKMDNALDTARRDEFLEGVRLFVRDGSDTTREDVARAFCVMEDARRNGRFKLIATANP